MAVPLDPVTGGPGTGMITTSDGQVIQLGDGMLRTLTPGDVGQPASYTREVAPSELLRRRSLAQPAPVVDPAAVAAPVEPTDPYAEILDAFEVNAGPGPLTEAQKSRIKAYQESFGRNFYNQRFQGLQDYYNYAKNITDDYGNPLMLPETQGPLQEFLLKYMPPAARKEYEAASGTRQSERARKAGIAQIRKLEKEMKTEFGEDFEVDPKLYAGLGILKQPSIEKQSKEEFKKQRAAYEVKERAEAAGQGQQFMHTEWDPSKGKWISYNDRIKDLTKEIISTSKLAENVGGQAGLALQKEIQRLQDERQDYVNRMKPTYIPVETLTQVDALKEMLIKSILPPELQGIFQ